MSTKKYPKSQSSPRSQSSQRSQLLEGSHAIALTINNIAPAVVSAYPITPQTHIVEDLAVFKADGRGAYEYLRAESEFAAASIVLGSSAAGARVYSATSSQGLLLMAEVVYNIAGMRLPVVMTVANRAVSGPINIWNDQQDIMAVRDSGWLMFFAEDNQEAIDQHIIAYKIAEKLKLPAFVNVDGFVLTHCYEPVVIPSSNEIKKYLPNYKPALGEYLNPVKPVTLGAFASPADYLEIRMELHQDLLDSLQVIKDEFADYYKKVRPALKNKKVLIDNGLIEYYGPSKPELIIISLGSVIGTIKDAVDTLKSKVGILKIKTYRPFPELEIKNTIKKLGAKKIIVIEKALSLGAGNPVATEIKAALADLNLKVFERALGLGGRDITRVMIKKIINDII